MFVYKPVDWQIPNDAIYDAFIDGEKFKDISYLRMKMLCREGKYVEFTDYSYKYVMTADLIGMQVEVRSMYRYIYAEEIQKYFYK